eukprot:378767_1
MARIRQCAYKKRTKFYDQNNPNDNNSNQPPKKKRRIRRTIDQDSQKKFIEKKKEYDNKCKKVRQEYDPKMSELKKQLSQLKKEKKMKLSNLKTEMDTYVEDNDVDVCDMCKKNAIHIQPKCSVCSNVIWLCSSCHHESLAECVRCQDYICSRCGCECEDCAALCCRECFPEECSYCTQQETFYCDDCPHPREHLTYAHPYL